MLVLAPQSYYIDRGTPIDTDILLRALSARGEQVDALVYHEGENRDYPGVTLHRIRAPRWLRNIGPGFSMKKLACDVLMFAHARRLVASARYDVIHAGEETAFMAMYFKFRRGIPYIFDMDSSIAQQMVEKMGWLKPVAWFLNGCEARAIRGALAVAPVCNALADLARKRGAHHVETLHDISQLAQPDRPSTGELRRRLGLNDDPVVMYVGNFEKYQGLDLLVEGFAVALQKGSRSHLVVAGGRDSEIEEYRAKAASLGIAERTHFLGPWPANRLDELLVQADILSAPRIKGINTPMKVFPYLHTGRAVLVTDLPTHTQVLDASVCALAPADPEGFGEAIRRLVSDKDLRERLGKAGRQFVETNHTFKAHQRRVDKLYDCISDQLRHL